MIDRFGNKIISAGGEVDVALLKAEINFLMKGFQKDPTDTKARLMAIKGEKLSANLNSSASVRLDLTLLDQLITAMVDYCPHSKNRDIPWYMAWLCRDLHYSKNITAIYGSGKRNYLDLTCLFFECYEQVEPTNQGRNLLVNTYCLRAVALMEAKETQKDLQALAILEKAKACEQKMDPQYSLHNRFQISEQLYEMLYKLYTRLNKEEESFNALLQAIGCAKKGNAVKKDSRSMRSLARFSCLYTQHPLYDPLKDPIDLQNVILELETYHKKAFFSGIRTYLEQLAKFKK